MRLTVPLAKQSMRWLTKQMMKRRGVIKEPYCYIPVAIADKDIINASAEYLKPDIEPEEYVPSVPEDPRFAPDPAPEDHRDYHEDPIHSYGSKNRLLEGEKQAFILTHTQPIQGLPQHLVDLVGQVNIPNQDELVQRYIMQANIWDPTKDRLPTRFNKQIPGWKFKREFGIPPRRSTSILLQNMLRLCQTLAGKYPDLLHSRRFFENHYVSTFYKFSEEKTVQINGAAEWMMTSDRPLTSFATEEQVDESVSYEMPDMWPVAPTVDLKSENIYQLENNTGFLPKASHAHPHTLYINNSDYWSTSQRNARAVMFCYAHCLAYAKQKFGLDVEKLPEPVSMQCVHTNGKLFSFICFQLNTLDLSSNTGVKNLAWFDNDNLLFNKIEPKRAMLRNTKYEDYDPEVFGKFLAFYLNGGKLIHKELIGNET